MKRLFVLVLFFFVATSAWSQDSIRHSYRPQTWERFTLGVRASAGLQRSLFGELGFAVQRCYYSPEYLFASFCVYSTAEWTYTPPGRPTVWAFKAGAEMAQDGGVLALDVKYQTDFEKADWVITPKIGYGISMLHLFYGYNLSVEKYPFPNVGKHQFSIAFNSNALHHRKPEKNVQMAD